MHDNHVLGEPVEVLLEDADRVGLAIDQERTHAQRGADALVALARRVTDAAGRPR